LFFSATGRIAPKPFTVGVAVIYLLAFLSQFLLAAPLKARGGLVAFVLLQAAITWAWYALHTKRLRDAGRPTTPAIALAVLYALAVPLFLLVMAAAMIPASASATGEASSGGFLDVFLVLFLFSVIFNDPGLGVFGIIILAVLVLVMLPFLIALAFSVWLVTRPSVSPSPPP
jgi:uncharacterized membrane protein YhaH (DUF805 family)